jgi:plastocyanin
VQPDQPIIVNGTPIAASQSYNSSLLRRWNNPRIMTILIAVLIAVILIGGSVWFYTARQGSDMSMASATVQVSATGFTPSTVKIKKGQGVTWTDKDVSAHQIYADQTVAPSLNSIDVLLTGDSYTYVFEKPGTYHYYDPMNASQFVGTVIVE